MLLLRLMVQCAQVWLCMRADAQSLTDLLWACKLLRGCWAAVEPAGQAYIQPSSCDGLSLPTALEECLWGP